jgi:ribonucleoside-diphosphate reductase alpha chain
MSETITQSDLSINCHFTQPYSHPYQQIEWERRDAIITNAKGESVFEQRDVEVPASWSLTATNIVASKYFHGKLDGPGRENSVRQLIDRVVNTISENGLENGYFQSPDAADDFKAELTFILVNQYAAFNSPVWFNVGCHHLEPENVSKSWHLNATKTSVVREGTGYSHPQCSACFINSVKDSMESILDLAKTEGMLFKWGSGTGTNFSPLRGSKETLSGGGTASGPISFMRGYDAFAGVIKSGGKTRRAAKMVILDADHPDIEDFIDSKGKEEAKAYALMREGYDGNGPDSEAYSSVFFQNANNSVRVTDEFMESAIAGKQWNLTARTDGATVKTVNAADLLRKIAEETWRCGDPGMQFDTTINKWHTSSATGRINSSNPCSEYMFLDDTACNLASLNLVKFLRSDGSFDVAGFQAAVRVLIIAQDILVDMAGYPTEQIARNSHDFRPLGLGYANLGALLLELGLPYDSEDGRAYAAAVTALMGGTAYKTSAELASALQPLVPCGDFPQQSTGAFPGFRTNAQSFRRVMELHRAAATKLPAGDVADAALKVWSDVIMDSEDGFRNSQVTVLAPTGTIGFMMDCDTTGVEPMLGLVTWKKLVGGGYMTLVNQAVPRALARLGYEQKQIDSIVAHIDEHGTIEGADIGDRDLPVFDSALTPAKGKRSINWKGHIEMMAAVQPFLSGAISKTVNLPGESTVEDIANAYVYSWKTGLKAVAIYRDGSKAAQPMSVKKEETKEASAVAVVTETPDPNAPPRAARHRLPDERASLTHKFNFAGHEGYITVGLYPNGQPGEIFIRMAKEGSTISGLMDSFAMVFSTALQHGVPLKVICDKLAHTRFEPSGWTGNDRLGYAKSVMDYIARWLQLRFLEGEQLDIFTSAALRSAAVAQEAVSVASAAAEGERTITDLLNIGDAPLCSVCGSQTTPSGSCFRCPTCGGTTGCS